MFSPHQVKFDSPPSQELPAYRGEGKAGCPGAVLDHETQVRGHFHAKAMKALTPFLWPDREIPHNLGHRTTACRTHPPRGQPFPVWEKKINLCILKPLRFGGSFVTAAQPSLSSLPHQRWQAHEAGTITKSLAPGQTLLIHPGTLSSPSRHVLQAAHTNRAVKRKR